MRRTCKFCSEPIEWLFIRFGNNAPGQYRWAAVSVEPDPEGRVVLWNGEWIKLRNAAPYKVEVEHRRRLHGPRQCLVSNDKGESSEYSEGNDNGRAAGRLREAERPRGADASAAAADPQDHAPT
jgi:hypothetical protein